MFGSDPNFFSVFWLKWRPFRRPVVLSILRFFVAIHVMSDLDTRTTGRERRLGLWQDSFPWHVFQDPTQAKADVTALKPNSKVFVLLGK